jgi:hypothetical protein
VIAWYLNEIRWGIYEYLTAEFRRAARVDVVQGLQLYKYEVPADISDPLVRSMYWDLMNNIRMPPYFPRFTVDRFMRDLY